MAAIHRLARWTVPSRIALGCAAALVTWFLVSGFFGIRFGDGRTFGFAIGAGACYFEWRTAPVTADTRVRDLPWNGFQFWSAYPLGDESPEWCFKPHSWGSYPGSRGGGITVPLWPLVAIGVIAAAWFYFRTPCIGPGSCSCGYNLTGNTSGRCPECGSPTPAPDPGGRTRRPVARPYPQDAGDQT